MPTDGDSFEIQIFGNVFSKSYPIRMARTLTVTGWCRNHSIENVSNYIFESSGKTKGKLESLQRLNGNLRVLWNFVFGQNLWFSLKKPQFELKVLAQDRIWEPNKIG
jgi:hypothetical protein